MRIPVDLCYRNYIDSRLFDLSCSDKRNDPTYFGSISNVIDRVPRASCGQSASEAREPAGESARNPRRGTRENFVAEHPDAPRVAASAS